LNRTGRRELLHEPVRFEGSHTVKLPFTLLDVFALRPLEGNLLAVVHDADALPDRVMATLAHRLQLSETSFLQQATRPGATYRHRIFTISGEIPFAGHPSLGAAVAYAYRVADFSAEYVQETKSGLQLLWVQRDGAHARARLRQNPAQFGPEVDATALIASIGLPPEASHPDLPAQTASTGLTTTIVPLASPDLLARIAVDWAAFGRALKELPHPQLHNCYVVAERGSGHWAARMFAPDMAGGEDPATGSAAGPFGAYLQQRLGLSQVVIDQGVEMGSPSRLEVDLTDGIVVGGDVWITGEGTLDLPV
jgi:trans-2,3-dihydro-3-hydroxyanthranilate isomerase